LLCVDATFLKGKYKGQIFSAIGHDDKNQIILLAFGFVESGDIESWLHACRYTRANKDNGTTGPNEETSWQYMQSRWCMRHLGANFFSYFRSKTLMNLFKKLCEQNQERKYTYLRGKFDYSQGNKLRRGKLREQQQ
jgi:hypothetical protein